MEGAVRYTEMKSRRYLCRKRDETNLILSSYSLDIYIEETQERAYFPVVESTVRKCLEHKYISVGSRSTLSSFLTVVGIFWGLVRARTSVVSNRHLTTVAA